MKTYFPPLLQTPVFPKFQASIPFPGIPFITPGAALICPYPRPTVPTPAHFLWKFSERKCLGSPPGWQAAGLREPYTNMPTSYVNKMHLDTLKVIVETQHARWRCTLEVARSTLEATALGDQARKPPENTSCWQIQRAWDLVTGHKCWETLWNHLSQATLTKSPSDKCTCLSFLTTRRFRFWYCCHLPSVQSEYSNYLWVARARRIILCLIYLHTLTVAREKSYFDQVQRARSQIDLVI